MTIAQLIGEACEKIDLFDALFLLADVLHVSRAHLNEYPDHVVGKREARLFHKYVRERTKGTPTPYIVGYAVFYNLAIGVTKDVMIPRSTSEQIVTLALQKIHANPTDRTLIIDVGTGSGCIPIAIGKNVDVEKYIQFFATDISKKALHVAQKNAEFHEVPIEFLRGDLLLPVLEKRLIPKQTHVVLTAHLPYISTEKTHGRAEPKVALDGGPDGLDLYRQFFLQVQGLLSIPGVRLDIFCECAPEQMRHVMAYTKTALPRRQISIYPDEIGQKRIIHVSL